MSKTREYLETLYQHSLSSDGTLDDDVEIEIRSFRPAPRKGALHAYRAAASIDAAIALINEDGGRGADVYNGVHLRRRGAGAGGEANVARLTAVIADVDTDKRGLDVGAVLAALNGLPFGGPTMIVQSGGGFHAYWLYREPVEADDATHAKHRRVSAWVRSWLNDRLEPAGGWPLDKHGNELTAADDMSTRDRILRPPGTRNMKPERAAANGGQAPEVRLHLVRASRMFDLEELDDAIPPGFNPDVHAKTAGSRDRADATDRTALPTEVPAKIQRALSLAGVGWKAMGTAGIQAIKLFPCPACGQRDGGCYVHPITGTLRTFHNTSCPSAKRGGLQLADWIARYAPAAQPALDTPTPAPKSQLARATRLAMAFGAFSREPSIPLAWGQALATGIALSDVVRISHEDVEHVPQRGTNAFPRRLAGLLPDGASGSLLPLRDAEGVICQGVWFNTPGLDGQLLPPGIGFNRGDDVVAGRLQVLGSVPEALARAAGGSTLLVTFGPLDYIAAIGLIAVQALDAVALGIVGHDAVVIDWLVDEWTRANVRPDRVVIIENDACDRAHLRRLDGCAGTAIVDVPGAGLIGALATEASTAALARRITRAGWHFRPPTNIMESGPQIMADLRHAVMLAAHTSRDDSPVLVVYTPPPGTGKSTVAQGLAGDIAMGAFSVPIRGRRPRGVDPDCWPPPERAVAFAVPNHDLADEKAAGHVAMGIAAPAVRHKGALAYCQFEPNTKDAYAYVGRRGICGAKGTDQRCEFADTCPGADAPKSQRGVVSYVAEAMAAHMKWDFVFIDENTGVVHTDTTTQDKVQTLFAGTMMRRVKKWRVDQNPEASEAAQLLMRLFTPLALEHGRDVGAGKIDPYPRRITGDELCKLIERDARLPDLLSEGFSGKATPPPVPLPAELRSGKHAGRHMPDLGAYRSLQALRAFYRKARELDAPEQGDLFMLPGLERKETPSAISILVLGESGAWSLETREIKKLPKAPIVMLDATGELTIEEYKAAFPHYNVKMMGMRVWGSQPRAAVHVKTKGVSRTALVDRSGSMKAGAIGTIKRLLTTLIDESRRAMPRARLGRDLSVGVLTYKVVADALTVGALKSYVTTMRARGVQIDVGYFGRDDRGTNRFEAVDALAVIGDARPNLGDVDADCGLLGLSTSKTVAGRAEAVITQAVYRARHTRRAAGLEPLIMLAASERPDIAGVVWHEINMPVAGVVTDLTGLAYEMMSFLAVDLGLVGAAVARTADWTGFHAEDPLSIVSARHAQAAAAQIARERRWDEYRVLAPGGQGRPSQVWASTEDVIARWGLDVARSAGVFLAGDTSGTNILAKFARNREIAK